MPVTTRAGQTRHLDAEHQTDPAEADFGDQALKAGPIGRAAGAAKILVDDEDALAGPAQLNGAFDQTVLQTGRLLMTLDLLRRRLPETDDRRPVTMAAGDLVRQRDQKAHGPASPVPRTAPPADLGPAGRSARQSAAAGSPAAGATPGRGSEPSSRHLSSQRARASRLRAPTRGFRSNSLASSDVPTCGRGGGHEPIQARDRRHPALPGRPGPGGRNPDRGQGAQPHVGPWTPGLRPRRLKGQERRANPVPLASMHQSSASLSARAASVALRSVMSTSTFTAPMIAPAASRSGVG